MTGILAKLRRGLRKPPHVILARMRQEAGAKLDRYLSATRPDRLSLDKFLRLYCAHDIGELWDRLTMRPYPAVTVGVNANEFEYYCPGGQERILKAAQRAMDRKVDLLGTGPVLLGSPIDWIRDVKTGRTWPRTYAKSIEYSNLEQPSDVKVPWEISRLQWLIPAGQAYLLTGDETYAACVRDIVIEWLDGNQYARTVNWSCTMEAAMRIFTLTWFFHVFSRSAEWKDESFRFCFLQSIFLHAEYTERHIEISDIAGNHYTADAAALVFAGLFFGTGADAARWVALGWKTLSTELPKQVYSDGVDFEASVPYHRLVQELFFFPALYRRLQRLPVEKSYCQRLESMARFSATYSNPDGLCPLWGDADDARTLPFGHLNINDHRYLVGLGAIEWSSDVLRNMFSGPIDEIFWVYGVQGCKWLMGRTGVDSKRSAAFPDGGFYIMRNQKDHVFIDCGPVGLGGRGGHGHNDCLSFEATLDGIRLITDCGAYVYTASALERNNFRSTGYHNTPLVDREEINRFIAWNALWTVRYDAKPHVHVWKSDEIQDVFQGSHDGYRRLRGTVVPIREIQLEHGRHRLLIRDWFQGEGSHTVEIPLHLHPSVHPEVMDGGAVALLAEKKRFEVKWDRAEDWTFSVEPARISMSYGVVSKSAKLLWRREGPLVPLTVTISPLGTETVRSEPLKAEVSTQ